MSRVVGPHPGGEPGSRAGPESPAAQRVRVVASGAVGGAAAAPSAERLHLRPLVVVEGARVGPPHLAQDLLEALRLRGDGLLLLVRHRHRDLADVLRHGVLLLLGGPLHRLVPGRPEILRRISFDDDEQIAVYGLYG